MSKAYDIYLINHKQNVLNAFEWIREFLPELIPDSFKGEWQIRFAHDQSKNEADEYDAYDAYFYGNNRSFECVQNFQKAWLLHVHRNPHHWQHWVLINDDPEEGEIILDMPYEYIIEMICDWWSFGWSNGTLDEIFSWYDKHSKYMKLSDKTREIVEDILRKIKLKLKDDEDADEKKQILKYKGEKK